MKKLAFVLSCVALILSGSLQAKNLIYFPNKTFPYSKFESSLKRNLLLTSNIRVSSPPKEYFSINTIYLRNKHIVHIGKDLINGNHVIMPSPNVMTIQSRSDKKKLVRIEQYFPDLEAKLMEKYALTPSQIHYLYITSYKVIDQYGELIETIHIPDNVHYRPPATMTLEVDESVRVLSFIFSFTSRTAWADSGVGSDLSSIYHDLRDMNIDRDARLFLKIDPENTSDIYEVFNSKESQKINQILSELHQVIVWGDMPNQEEILKELLDLKTFQYVSVDLKNLAADLAKYPHLFGNPVDPRWISKFEKIKAHKFREEEINRETSGSLSLGVKGLFDLGGSASHKTHNRLKEVFEFEMDGEFYVPKAIKFALRADNSLSMLKTLTFQVYQNLEEKQYFLGVGVELEQSEESIVSFKEGAKTKWVNNYDQPVKYRCPDGQALTGVTSQHNSGAEDRIFSYQCSEGSLFDKALSYGACTEHKNVNRYDGPVNFSCPKDSVLVSERSYHNNGAEDRVFSYTCCELQHPYVPLGVKECSLSPFVNSYDAYLNYKCPANMVLKGTKSRHHSGAEDRQFRFECCSLGEVR